MTNNLQRELGKGGFGKVYHGTVNGSEQVAVKVLSQSSTQGDKEFKAEVSIVLLSSPTKLLLASLEVDEFCSYLRLIFFLEFTIQTW